MAARNKNKVIVRCYAERDDDSWFAICLDLNLQVRADDLQSARKSLHQLIHRYLQEAIGPDRAHFHDLVPRRAPLVFWVKFYWLLLRRWFKSATPERELSFKFRENIPQMV